MRLRFLLVTRLIPILCFASWSIGLAQQPPPRPVQVSMQPQVAGQPSAQSPVSCHVSIKGAKQGQFKGFIDGSKRSGIWIPCIQFSYSVTALRDPASGQGSGRRQYSPVFFTKEWDPASPQILTALAASEVLPEVKFEFVKSDRKGIEIVFQTVTLTDATIVQAKQTALSSEPGTRGALRPIDEVSLAFRKIVVENNEGKTVFIEDSPGSM